MTGKHEVVAASPTYPKQRVLRTVVLDVLVWGPTVLAAIPVAVEASKSLEHAGLIPPAVEAEIAAIGVGAVAVKGFVTWLIAQPPVDLLLQRIGLGSVPKADANVVAVVKDTAGAVEAIAGRLDPPPAKP